MRALPALLAGCATAAIAQGGGLTLTQPPPVQTGQPYFVPDRDEEAQAAKVFKSPRWKAFVELLVGEQGAEPDRLALELACRRSIGLARLTTHELLLDGCIEDALRRVDPAANYINARQHARMQREKRRPPGSMAIEIPSTKRFGDGLLVVSPIEGGPAAKAGIRAGDRIEAIDDVAISPLSLDDTLDLLRGEPGSVAHVKLRRGDETIEAQVTRDTVRTRAVAARRLAENVLFVRVSRFASGVTGKQLYGELQGALSAGPRPRLLVLDLRTNPGGALSEVVAAASLFVPTGNTIFGIASRSGTKAEVSTPLADTPSWAEVSAAVQSIPLVVLVDELTGGGTEALAHVLRERLQAKSAGSPTMRFDHILQIFDLLGEASVQLTVGHIVSASGQRYDGGVPLDLQLANTPRAEFGDLPADGLLAATLERFAR